MGGRAWVANGLMFGFNHIWQPWNLLLHRPFGAFGSLHCAAQVQYLDPDRDARR